jgi:hypothetical protein
MSSRNGRRLEDRIGDFDDIEGLDRDDVEDESDGRE